MADAGFQSKDYTSVNFAAVTDLISEWSSTVSEYSSSYQKASDDPTFQVLEELGFSNGFPQKFDNAMKGYEDSINAVIASVTAYMEELNSQDEQLKEQIPQNPRGGGRRSGGGGGSGSESLFTAQMGTFIGIDNTAEQTKFFEDISLSDLTEVLSILNTVATDNKLSIEEILDNETLGAKIKELLLNNVKISDQYKTMLKEGSLISMTTPLKSLVKGEIKQAFGLDQDTTLTLKSQLANIASENNIDYDDLVNADVNSSLLKSTLTSMKDVNSVLQSLTKDNVQSELLAIYDGNKTELSSKMTDSSKSIIKSEVDILSALSNINYEELLTVSDYSEELLKSTERLQRTALFAETLSNCKDAKSTLSTLLDKE
jgi:hypothetical protein